MRIDDIIYFSPELKAIDLNFEDRDQVVSSFKSRILEYYIKPARLMNENEHAFATGVILMTAIDAITNYSSGSGDRIKFFASGMSEVARFEPSVRSKIVKHFDDSFRNGLIHEGRVKNCGQFSYNYGSLLTFEHDCLIINPSKLLQEVESYFADFLETIKKDKSAYYSFIKMLKRQFENDIKRLKEL